MPREFSGRKESFKTNSPRAAAQLTLTQRAVDDTVAIQIQQQQFHFQRIVSGVIQNGQKNGKVEIQIGNVRSEMDTILMIYGQTEALRRILTSISPQKIDSDRKPADH